MLCPSNSYAGKTEAYCDRGVRTAILAITLKETCTLLHEALRDLSVSSVRLFYRSRRPRTFARRYDATYAKATYLGSHCTIATPVGHVLELDGIDLSS